MIAYVICANDSIKAVVLDDEEKALKESKKFADEYFKTHSFNFRDRAEYDHLVFWHLHEVEVL
jgi:hypothetical protein